MAEGFQTTVYDKVGGRSPDSDQTCADDNVPGRKGKRCDPCRTNGRRNDAVVLCKTCQQHQCEECSMNHTLNEIMVGHDLQGLEEEDQRKICIKHKQDLNIYCVDHDEMCCGLCGVMYHKQCTEVTDIKSGGKLSLSNIHAMCKNIDKDAENRMQTYQKQAKDIPDQIDIMKNEIVKLFDDFKCNVVQSTRDAVKTESKKKDDEKIVRTAITKDIDTTSATYSDDFYRMYLLTKMIKQHKNAISKQESDKHVLDFIFEFNKTLLSFIQSGDDIGSLKVEKTFTKATSGSFVRPFMLRLLASRNLKQDGDGDSKPHITGSDFLPDGRIVAVDNNNKKLLVYDQQLNNLATHLLVSIPQGIVTTGDRKAVITTGNKGMILNFNINADDTIIELPAFHCNRQYESISTMPGDWFCVTRYEHKYPVGMVSGTLGEKEFEPHLPMKQLKFNEAITTYIQNRQIVVLSDFSDNSINFYDVSGNTVITTVVRDASIRGPHGVCVGPGDCVFVCSKDTNSIVQLSPTGRLIGSCKVEISMPYRVAVSKDGTKLVVSNRVKGNRKLQIYELQ
ncbi:uncharacterized protein LOC128219367 [Mya arenaria]|uniref:uncharacterized protein LOC128219367 n=1 Tax=Mya arenaria TaxID=6604 RepID=UPI0022E6A54F|nr:uncharacterized protein LOC128219367 [Mya arenaria]